MLENGGEADRQRRGELADRCGALRETDEHTAPNRVCEGREGAIELMRIVKHALN
jgi:hypothetical protein